MIEEKRRLLIVVNRFRNLLRWSMDGVSTHQLPTATTVSPCMCAPVNLKQLCLLSLVSMLLSHPLIDLLSSNHNSRPSTQCTLHSNSSALLPIVFFFFCTTWSMTWPFPQDGRHQPERWCCCCLGRQKTNIRRRRRKERIDRIVGHLSRGNFLKRFHSTSCSTCWLAGLLACLLACWLATIHPNKPHSAAILFQSASVGWRCKSERNISARHRETGQILFLLDRQTRRKREDRDSSSVACCPFN